MIDRNQVTHLKGGGTVLEGADAMAMLRALQLAAALRLYAKCGLRPTRTVGPAAMMRMAAQITGKRYKARDYLGAAADVTRWAETMNAALPHTTE